MKLVIDLYLVVSSVDTVLTRDMSSIYCQILHSISLLFAMSHTYTVSQKNCATFIFTVTLANVGRFLKFFYSRNQKEIADNKKEKFPTAP